MFVTPLLSIQAAVESSGSVSAMLAAVSIAVASDVNAQWRRRFTGSVRRSSAVANVYVA